MNTRGWAGSDGLYNSAAAYAHAEERADAVQWLKRAIQLNPALGREAQQDEDFQSLRSDPDFLALTGSPRSAMNGPRPSSSPPDDLHQYYAE